MLCLETYDIACRAPETLLLRRLLHGSGDVQLLQMLIAYAGRAGAWSNRVTSAAILCFAV